MSDTFNPINSKEVTAKNSFNLEKYRKIMKMCKSSEFSEKNFDFLQIHQACDI